jgi:polysaccharide export outer membrane protein
MLRLSLKVVFSLVSAAALGSAQSAPAPRESVDKTNPAPAANGAASADSATSVPYVIGPLDVLYIKVWNNAQLTSPYDVRPDGMLSMPLIGEVKADDLTVAQLTEKLKMRLSEFLKDPVIDIQVAKINSKRYFVYGGVTKPGEFPLVGKTTVMDALSMVGDFKDFANRKKIRIQRGSQTLNFNYNDVSRGKHMEQNVVLQNGDRIFVPD